ncbi:hypothetical protein ACSBR1_027776 [Camellia fascicularis]
MDPKTLFKLFSKFGIVKDVFIPQKRRKVTNTRFGFVKYDCSVAANVAVTKANGLWVEDKEIQVKMAEYDRVAEGAQNRNQLKGNKGANEACGRNVRWQHGHGWLYESVILRFKDEYYIHGIEKIFKEKRIGDVMVRSTGGRDVMVKDVHSSNEAINQEPVGGGNEVDDMAKEVKEDGDDQASSDIVVEEN